MTWHCAKTETPEVGRRIVAVYADGRGAALFMVAHDGLLYDADGFDGGSRFFETNYSLWAYLPDDFRLWCELREKDPIDLSKIKPEGER